MRGFGEKGYWIGGLGRVDGKKKVILKIQLGRKEEEKSIMVFDLMVESVFFSIFGHMFWVFLFSYFFFVVSMFFSLCFFLWFFVFSLVNFFSVYLIFLQPLFAYLPMFFLSFISLSLHLIVVLERGLNSYIYFAPYFRPYLSSYSLISLLFFNFHFFLIFFENMLEIKVKQCATCHVSRFRFLYTPYIFVLMPSFDNFVTFEPLKILDSCKFYIHEFL